MIKFLLLFCFISTPCLAKEIVYSLTNSETQQVNKLYFDCGGQDWKNNTGWLLVNKKFSSTFSPFGIEFFLSDEVLSDENDTITKRAFISEIDLNTNNLSGEIPKLNLPYLELLNLSYNNLSGEIPSFNLPKLKELKLIINDLIGPLPSFNLPNLEKLILGGNQIGDTIPNFDLPKLQFLSLRDNNLIGEIPDFDLPNLEMLNLRNNLLRGEIPNFNLPKLTLLRLQTNGLSGKIPDFNLSELEQMYLSENLLSGEIPDFDLPKLDAINLDNNNLSGTLPNFNLKTLRWAYFHNNQISGEIPDFDLPVLEVLSLQNNLFKGEIPDFDLPNLEYLDIAENKFTFGPLETNLNKYFDYQYDKQDTVLPLTFSDNLLVVDSDGTQNIYTWFRDNTEIATNYTGELSGVEKGIYFCEIRNSLLPDLTLRSEYYELIIKNINQENDNQFSIRFDKFTNLLRIKSDRNKIIDRVNIYSLSGNLVFHKLINESETLMNTDKFTSGAYFIVIISEGRHFLQKIILP